MLGDAAPVAGGEECDGFAPALPRRQLHLRIRTVQQPRQQTLAFTHPLQYRPLRPVIFHIPRGQIKGSFFKPQGRRLFPTSLSLFQEVNQ